jgi:RNA polymerase sigma factor (sigma-70 family)
VETVAAAHRTTSVPDAVLVQEAAAGGGASYAALYDRYAQQVYNYCLRLTGSPDDAADATQDAFVNVLARLHKDDRPVLEFSSYLFAAARNESYALMRRRSRAQPAEDVPERASPEPDVETDPERAVLLHDSQELVRQANAKLPPRHREVLALREVAGRSYDEIGRIMGISENAAAQLIWRARAKLKGAITAGAVASVVATSEDCEAAQLLINRLHDGERVTPAEQEWLDKHLDECERCRATRGLVLEVATSYRMWAPVALIATMKGDVLAQAGHVIGADWTGAHLTGGGAGGANGGGGAGANGAGANGAHAAGATGAHGAGRFVKRPRGAQAAAGSAVTAGIFAAVAIVVTGLGHDNASVTPSPPAAKKSAPAKASAAKAAPAKADAAVLSTAARVHPRAIHGPAPSQPGAAQHAAPPTPAGGAPEHAAPPQKPAPRHRNPGGGNPGGGAPQQPVNPPVSPRDTPTPPSDGPPQPQPPPVVDPPVTPPSGGECSWPGHGNGPGGCPPGHGGIPPGEGGTPPGQSKKP